MNTMTAQDRLTAMHEEGGYTLAQIREAQAAARAEAERAHPVPPTEAETAMNALIQAAEDGKDVKPAQLAEARAAVELDQVKLRGRAKRAVEKAEKERQVAISAAQATVAKTIPTAQASLTKAYTDAVDALAAMGAALHEYDAVVLAAGRTLAAAQAPKHLDPSQPEPTVYAIHNHGDTAPVHGVVLNGKAYPRAKTNGAYVAAAVSDSENRMGKPWASSSGRSFLDQLRRDGGESVTRRPANLPEGN